jgi:hypothetical protein
VAQLTVAGQTTALNAYLADLTKSFAAMEVAFAKTAQAKGVLFSTPPIRFNPDEEDPLKPDIGRLTERLLENIGLPAGSQERKQLAYDLDHVADLLEKPHGWVQFTMHKTIQVMDAPQHHMYTRALRGDFVSPLEEIPARPRTIMQHCTMGAIEQVMTNPRDVFMRDENQRRMELAVQVIGCTLPGGATIPAWNDWPTRTQAEVVGHVRAVARRLADD